MAGKVAEVPDRPGGDWGLARAFAANEDRHAAESDENLRGAACHGIGGDLGPEHLDIPIRRRFGILADDVNMVEFESEIAHRSSLVCEIGRGDRLSFRTHQLQ